MRLRRTGAADVRRAALTLQALLGQGYGEHLSQVLAHCIMGSSFIAYGIFMLVLQRLGGAWMRRTKRSPDLFDNLILFLYGFVNTFTEHSAARHVEAELIRADFFGENSSWSSVDAIGLC